MKQNQTCDKCQDTGWILVEKDGTAVARRCECYFRKQSRIRWEQAGIPKRYRDCTLNNFEVHNDSHKDALKLSRRFVDNYPAQEVGLLFIGPCGVGKTHLAAAILSEVVAKKKARGYFCDFRELIRNIQATYSQESGQRESEVLAPVFRADVLVLDELGAKRTTAWVEDTVFYIINNRYNNNKLTLFTSNYLDDPEDDEEDKRDAFFKKSDETLLDRIGVRLRSRIYEMCRVVNIGGDDYRKKIKQGAYRF